MDGYSPPEREDVTQWAPLQGPPCTETNFTPDPHTVPKSNWNRATAKVFVETFLAADDPTFQGFSRSEIESGFFKRVKSWQYRVKNPLTEEEKQEKRRKERKRTLYQRRLRSTMVHPEARRHSEMVKAYGASGMSTDESEHETTGTGAASYNVKSKFWRHPEAEPCFTILDALHRNTRFRPGGSKKIIRKRGGQERIRVVSANPKQSNSEPVLGLPSHLYHPRLDGSAVAAQPSEDRYDFHNTTGIINIATNNTGRLNTLRHFR
ncbi:hypothetical protein DFP72DRAFT_827168 [Ephemerocybe angulata]|uniref:Uncharacterized protein n=1 Tax=Ephemerocybe angulata TaxID=980116 RepID=A0A8H6HDB6_9AGAR|nr:hypothetical protein DFP72DRAFT_827168 [Tulosesus angulatus]